MHDWREVQSLRKAGQISEARRIGEQLLADRTIPENPLVQQLSWTYYDILKQLRVKILEASRPDVREFQEVLRIYARLKPPRPDLCHSLILKQTLRVGRLMDRYLQFLQWGGDGQYRPEDFEAEIHTPKDKMGDDSRRTATPLALVVQVCCWSCPRYAGHAASGELA